jgi:hypothetical protein
MTAPNAAFSQMITAQHRFQGKTITDQFVEHNALWRMLKERGNVKTEADGGPEITYPIAYAANETIMNYTEFQRHNVSQTDFLTNVKYDWRQKAAYVIASGKELRVNRGKGQMIKLVTAKKSNLIDSISNHMATEAYGDGSVDGSIGGLASIITDNGQGTVGGISGNTYSWWRNKVQDEDSGSYWATPDNIKRSLNKLHIKCTIGSQKPDLYVLTNDLYEVYQASLQAQQRFMVAKKAEAGFETLMMTDSTPVIHDLNASGGFTGEVGYALNTKYLYLVEHTDARWGAEAERKPLDQDGIAIPYYWMGQMICTSRRHQGKLVAA